MPIVPSDLAPQQERDALIKSKNRLLDHLDAIFERNGGNPGDSTDLSNWRRPPRSEVLEIFYINLNLIHVNIELEENFNPPSSREARHPPEQSGGPSQETFI